MGSELDARVLALLKESAGGFAAMRRGSLDVKSERLIRAADVRASLGAHAGDGWVCSTGQTPMRWRGALPESPLLSAELAVDARRSVHLRYSGDSWLLTTIIESDGSDCIGFDTRYLSSIDEEGRLGMKYRTWWRPEKVGEGDVAVWRPWVARFVGWESV